MAAEDLAARAALRRAPRPGRPGEQLRLDDGAYHYYVLVTNDQERDADELESWHRAKANVENRIKEAKLGLGLDNLPCRGFHANSAYLLCTLLAYNLLGWLKLLALPAREQASYAKRLRFRFIAAAATVGRSGRRIGAAPRGRVPAPLRLPARAPTPPRARAGARLTRPPVRRPSSTPPRRRSHPLDDSPARAARPDPLDTAENTKSRTARASNRPRAALSAPYRRIRVARCPTSDLFDRDGPRVRLRS